MRVLALVPGESERDAVLAALEEKGLGPTRLARLPPFTATRVIDCGAGTLVLVPVGGASPTLAACATGVACNRITPDLVLAIDLPVETEPALRLAAEGPGGEPLEQYLLDLAAARLPGALAEGSTGAIGSGAYAAAAVHRRRFLALSAPACGLATAVLALLSSELR